MTDGNTATWDGRLRRAILLLGVFAAGSMVFLPSGCGNVEAKRRSLEERRQAMARIHAERLANQAARHEQELQGRIPDPIHAALADPTLDLKGVTERIALAVVPEARQVAVTVERFTDFQLTVRLDTVPDLSRMADWTRRIVPPLRSHLASLRFVVADRIVGRLGREDLEAEVDWARWPEAEIGRRLQPPLATGSAVERDPQAPGDLDEPTNPHWTSVKKLTEALSERDLAVVRDVATVSGRLRECATLTPGLDFRTLELRIRTLGTAKGDLQRLTDEFRSLEEEFPRLVEEQGLHPELVGFLERVERPRWKAHLGSRIETTRSLSPQVEALEAFLQELRKAPRLWKAGRDSIAIDPGPEGDPIRARLREFQRVLAETAGRSPLRFEESLPVPEPPPMRRRLR